MVFKLENSSINIDCKSIFKGFVIAGVCIEICKAIYRSEQRYSIKLKEELKRLKKEQKISKKKQKVESK